MRAILRIMGMAALAMTALSGFAQQSLDETDRASYKAGKSPLEQAGAHYARAKSVKFVSFCTFAEICQKQAE